MFAFIYELIVAILGGLSPARFVFLLIIAYLWLKWLVVFLSSRRYRPWEDAFRSQVSVIVPTYKEDWETLKQAVNSVLLHSSDIVAEVLIIGDERERETTVPACRNEWKDDPRVSVHVSRSGKRRALRLGIEKAQYPIVVVVESDTFAEPGAINELIKPFADPGVGGVVGEQLVYQPYSSLAALLNEWTEVLKYRFTIPFLSRKQSVTVLGGRCVAYRREAVLPLVDGLTQEKFLGKLCIAGDDGRLTSLLMATGWGTVYQSSAKFKTVSPVTYPDLLTQRLRWFRNGARRTLRALFATREKDVQDADRFWVWKRPRAAWQMLSVWAGTFFMLVLFYLAVRSITTGYYWHWFGGGIAVHVLRVLVILILGAIVTRAIKAFPAIQSTEQKKWLIAFPLFPFHLVLGMVPTRLVAIFTMNRQGWLSRQASGAGGFSAGKGQEEEIRAVGESQIKLVA